MPRSLGRYRIIAELGRGGMGIVSLAVAKGMGRFNKLIVLKELMPELADDPDYVGMFLDEARLAARLSHPNIVQSHELGVDGHRYFMAMDYLEGRTLSRILRRVGRKGRLSLGMHMRVLCEVLAGLHYAHELTDFDGKHLEIVHRDVSPHNIFVTFDGQVKLMDFGVAKTIDASQKTAPGMLKGKLGYMAPEQSRGDAIDRRSDIFTVGILMWEALVGRRMWEGMTDIEVLGKIVHGQVPTPESVKPDVPRDLTAICSRALSIDPEQRYPTAQRMLVEIETWLDSSRFKTSLRDLGAIVGEVFADERVQTKELIEGYLTKLDSGSSLVELANIEERVSTMAGRTPTQRASGLPDVAPARTDPPPSRTPGATAAAVSPASTSIAPTLASAPVAPRLRRAWPLLGAVLGAATVAALIAGVALRGPSGAIAATAAVPVAVASSAPAAPDATHDKVELTVRVTPADATIFVDDRPVGNPFRGTFPKDSAQHEVRATANGYDAKMQSVVFDGNVTVDMSLRTAAPPHAAVSPPPRSAPARAAPPRPATAPAGDAASAPAPVKPSAPELSTNGGKVPLRTIEPASPYGNP